MYKQHVLTLTGAAQRLSTALSLTENAQTNMAIHISLQPAAGNTNVIYVGDASVAADGSAHAVRLEAPSTSIPPAPYIFEAGQLQMSLADIYVRGTNTEKLHVGVVYG